MRGLQLFLVATVIAVLPACMARAVPAQKREPLHISLEAARCLAEAVRSGAYDEPSEECR